MPNVLQTPLKFITVVQTDRPAAGRWQTLFDPINRGMLKMKSLVFRLSIDYSINQSINQSEQD